MTIMIVFQAERKARDMLFFQKLQHISFSVLLVRTVFNINTWSQRKREWDIFRWLHGRPQQHQVSINWNQREQRESRQPLVSAASSECRRYVRP